MTVVKFRFLYALSAAITLFYFHIFSLEVPYAFVFLSTIVVTAAVENVYEYQREL